MCGNRGLEAAASTGLRFGGWDITVRSSTVEADRLIQRVFAAYLADCDHDHADEHDVVDYFVRIGVAEQSERAGRIHMLYESSVPAARSRRPSRIVHALAAHIASVPTTPRGLLCTSALALVSDDAAILVPRGLVRAVNALQPRIERHGLRFLDRPKVLVDPVTREVVVPPVPLVLDEDAVDEFDTVFSASTREPAPVAIGRYPLRAWAMVGDADAPPSRAAAVSAAMATIRPVVPAPDALAQVRDIFDAVPQVALVPGRHADVARQLLAMAS
jgi:hypothetical protein